MEKKEKGKIGNPFPEMIRKLPRIDIPLPGVKGWLLQGEDKQIVFFEINSQDEMPSHSHGDQWGIVVAGKMDLTIGGKTKTYKKGDRYFIPAGVAHSADFSGQVFIIDIFADRQRYTTLRQGEQA